MQINLSSGNYNIINSGQVFLFGEKKPFKIDVISDEDFRFDNGAGVVEPLKIATVGGKQLFIMFWSYLEGTPEKSKWAA